MMHGMARAIGHAWGGSLLALIGPPRAAPTLEASSLAAHEAQARRRRAAHWAAAAEQLASQRDALREELQRLPPRDQSALLLSLRILELDMRADGALARAAGDHATGTVHEQAADRVALTLAVGRRLAELRP